MSENVEVQLRFSRTVNSGEGYRQTQHYFKGGILTQIVFHFPPGCNGLVDMALFKDEKPFYPLTGYLALDDATPVIYGMTDYYEKEPLTLEVRNRDAVHEHTPTCAVTIRVKKSEWDK